MNNGWIRLDRKLLSHWVFETEDPAICKAWLYMLLTANHTSKVSVYKMKKYTIKRGQLCTSYDSLSRKWNMSIGKVRRFLKLLKNDRMIDIDTSNGFTLVTIVNYDEYQTTNNKQTDKQIDKQTDTQTDTQTGYTITNKQIKQNNNKGVKNTNTLIKYFGECYYKKFKVEYHASYGKDNKLLQSLITQYGYDDVRLAIKYFIDEYIDSDNFANKNPTISGLKMVWNGMISNVKNKKDNISKMEEWIHG